MVQGVRLTKNEHGEYVEEVYTYEEIVNEVIPESITRLQAMLVMKSMDIWDSFNSYLYSNQDAKDEWDLSSVLLISSTFIRNAKIALGLSDEQLNKMFIDGSAM